MKTLAMALSVGVGLLLMEASTGHAADLVLVNAGQPRAVVVTADVPSPVATFAVEELVAAVEKATGARLGIAKESEAPKAGVRVYVGATQAARKAGLDPDALLGETYRIKAAGGNLYILGKEDGKPLFPDEKDTDRYSIYTAVARRTRRGTLYGVIDFMERVAGVRWLWPGELGTYVPRREKLAVAGDLDVTGGPAFKFRNYRVATVKRPAVTGKYRNPVAARLSFSDEGLQRYYHALSRYLLIHQGGETEPQPRVGHRFQWWWGKYGKQHPDWFAMRDNGERGPLPGKRWGVRMCVTNPGLQHFLAEKDWHGGDLLSLGESDDRNFCRCPECKAWDEPQPAGYKGYTTANRYVRLAQTVHELAMKRNPNVRIAMFLYMDYTHAPTIDADLSWMVGEFCPWGSGNQAWYPMASEEHKANKAAWLGWHKTGMEMAYRPNHLLGYTMPNLSTRQTGDMIRFAAAHGMVGFDYDSLFGQWAVRGPMLYVHIRLGRNPDLTVDQVREEYFSAFGPAARQVEAYFDYWEHYSETKALHGGTDYGNCSKARKQYPPEAFAPAEALLGQALKLAQTSDLPEFAARVRFLQDGLKHAELAADFVGLYEAQEFAEARQALLDLVAFRRSHETDFIADYTASARTECSTYRNLGDLLDGKLPKPKPERPKVDIGTGWLTPWKTWYFYKDPKDQGLPERQFAANTFDSTGWTKVTVPANLHETPVGWYNAYGWYAVTFDVPKDWAGRDIELLFEGIDKQAWVYVNGKLKDEITVEAKKMTVGEIWASPFVVKVRATDVEAGGTNLLTVRMHSAFGAMGLHKPVRLRPVDAPAQ
ncbi:MAG: DUF4838 domain-containing protein [Victivallales bacterium]|jgi:hypothetical protein|nr:DUF4838 domain-containing protein [Victivallales bacterium]